VSSPLTFSLFFSLKATTQNSHTDMDQRQNLIHSALQAHMSCRQPYPSFALTRHTPPHPKRREGER
jgi:hypothetical protein